MLTMYTYKIINFDNSLNTAVEKHFNRQKLDKKGPHPLVLYRDTLGEGQWEWPAELLTWGRGYACVSVPAGPLWLPAKRKNPSTSAWGILC